jgi:hypothetical protein
MRLIPPVDPVIEQLTTTLSGLGHEINTFAVDSDVEPVVEAGTPCRRPRVHHHRVIRRQERADSSICRIAQLLGCRYTGDPAGLMLAGDKSCVQEGPELSQYLTPKFMTRSGGRRLGGGPLRFRHRQAAAGRRVAGINSASVVHGIKDLFDRIGELQLEYQLR